MIFKESNAEGKFTDVISKNSEPYQIQLTTDRRQKAKVNLVGVIISVAFVVLEIFGFALLPQWINNWIDRLIDGAIEKAKESLPELVKLVQSVCKNDKLVNQSFCQEGYGNGTEIFALPIWLMLVILATTVGVGIVFGIRYKKALNKLVFIQTIFSIYSYKYQNGLEES